MRSPLLSLALSLTVSISTDGYELKVLLKRSPFALPSSIPKHHQVYIAIISSEWSFALLNDVSLCPFIIWQNARNQISSVTFISFFSKLSFSCFRLSLILCIFGQLKRSLKHHSTGLPFLLSITFASFIPIMMVLSFICFSIWLFFLLSITFARFANRILYFLLYMFLNMTSFCCQLLLPALPTEPYSSYFICFRRWLLSAFNYLCQFHPHQPSSDFHHL